MVRLVLATPPAWLKNAIVLATGSLLLWDMLVFYMAGLLWVLGVDGDHRRCKRSYRLLDCKIGENTKAVGHLLWLIWNQKYLRTLCKNPTKFCF
jgi:hypothetical protein